MDKKYKKKRKIKIWNIISLVLVIVILFSLYNIGIWFLDNYKNSKIDKSFDDTKKKVEKLDVMDADKITNNLVSFDDLKKQNPDTVAWIRVRNTNINYPVVKCSNNGYYLYHSFDESENKAGWIFMDYRNRLDGTDKNIVIYGHNRRNKSMFGSLPNVLEESWYNNKDNYEMLYIDESGVHTYQVFSVYTIEDEDYYITTDFSNDEFESFIKTLKDRSIHDFNVNVTKDDSILTLSTCSTSTYYRVVLHAVRKDKVKEKKESSN